MSYNNENQRDNGREAGSDQSDVLTNNVSRIFSTLGDKLEKDVRDHLKKVYGTLAVSLGVAVSGGIFSGLVPLHSMYFVFYGAIIALMMAIARTDPSRQNEKTRLCYLFGLAFLIGCTSGPSLDMFMGAEDPSITFNVYLITCIVFGSFTLAALYTETTKYLHLGGILTSAIICLIVVSMFRGTLVHGYFMWVGLAIECGFVLYDTELIAQKIRGGDADYIWHTVMLFIDFVNIFRCILLTLKNKMDKDRRKRH